MKWLRRATALILCLMLGLSSACGEGLNLDEWQTRLQALVEQVGERQAFTDGEVRAREYLTAAFEQMGYTQRAQTLRFQWMAAPAAAVRKFGVAGMVNLIAVKPALEPDPAILIVSAHYDSVSGTAGAKDNGSGVAALLTLANAFMAKPAYADTEIRFVAFAAEEKGEYGSGYFTMELTEDERRRILGAFNIDLITLDEGAQNVALSCDTLGGVTPDGYRPGSKAAPAHNRISRAFEKAFWEEGGYAKEDRDVLFCIPRHFGDSDHLRFDRVGIDAANICFHGNPAAEGVWPADMHTPEDRLKLYDLQRTQQALNTLYRAIQGLAAAHAYGPGRRYLTNVQDFFQEIPFIGS